MTRTRAVLLATLAAAGVAFAHGAGDDTGGGALPQVRGVRKRPTYHRDVAPILRRACTTCHHEGDIAPMSLDTYDAAAFYADDLLDEIAAGRMPPWQPVEGVGKFARARGLSDREIATLAAWRDAGRPEGRAPRRARTPTYTDGWALGEPDAVLAYGEPFEVPRRTDDEYRCFPLATQFDHDVYVRAIDVRPGDRRVVHHVVLYMDAAGESHALDSADPGPGYTCFGGPGTSTFTEFGGSDFSITDTPTSPIVGGWAPGNRPHLLPRGSGVRIPAGATLVMQVHYHPLQGEDVPDATRIGLYLSDAPRNEDVFLLPVVNQDFTIPAGDPAYEVTAELDPRGLIRGLTGLDIPISGQVLSVMPHMHLLGREISVDVGLPDGTDQRLVEIDDWDFDWQDSYHFTRPVAAPIGSTLRLRCVFDNSAENANNPNSPPRPVSWGERTVDEMALAFVAVKLRFPDSVLDLFALVGRDAPHARGLPAIRAAAPPTIRSAEIDAEGRLVVDVRRLAGGGRIEVDGVPVATSLALGRGVRRLVAAADAAFGDAPSGTSFTLRVRRADGRSSPPFAFVR